MLLPLYTAMVRVDSVAYFPACNSFLVMQGAPENNTGRTGEVTTDLAPRRAARQLGGDAKTQHRQTGMA
jgi:hypothetical protein